MTELQSVNDAIASWPRGSTLLSNGVRDRRPGYAHSASRVPFPTICAFDESPRRVCHQRYPCKRLRSVGMKMRCCTFAMAFGLSLTCIAEVQSAAEISSYVISAGGTGGESASFVVRSTLGQPVIGKYSSQSYSIVAGFWRSHSEILAQEEETPGRSVPTAYALRRCSPNPLSASTSFQVDVPDDGGLVRIRIFEANGAEVRTLLAAPLDPGRTLVSWDGTDRSGHRVSSGVYFVVMSAPGYEGHQKVAITR